MGALIPLAIEFVPQIAKWAFGDSAAATAKSVGDIVTAVTGTTDEVAAANLARTNPEMKAQIEEKLQELATNLELAYVSADVQGAADVNATIQQEAKSEHFMTWAWRPFFGFCVALTWAVQMAAITYAIVCVPVSAPLIINSIAGLGPMWGIALGVLGIYTHSRSVEKQTAIAANSNTTLAALRTDTPSLWSALVSRVAK